MSQFFLTLEETDILCRAYSNFLHEKNIVLFFTLIIVSYLFHADMQKKKRLRT